MKLDTKVTPFSIVMTANDPGPTTHRKIRIPEISCHINKFVFGVGVRLSRPRCPFSRWTV